MKRFLAIFLGLALLILVGAFTYLGFTDAPPPMVRTLEIPVPNERLAP